MQKNEVEWKFILYVKINRKYIKDLNVKANTLQLLDKNIGINFWDLRLGSGFLNMILNLKYDTKVHTTKENLDHLKFLKIKNFCPSSDAIKKVKNRKVLQIVSCKKLYEELYKE